jgi:VWFA-related protein
VTRRSVARVLAGALIVASASASGGQAPPPAQRPFRSGIDIVLVDVTVLGRDGAPVATLDPADFTLTVDGRPRPIHSVRLVRAGETSTRPATTGAGGAAVPVPAEARRFVLLIDREHIPVGEGQQMLAAAAQFVDSLAPGDLVALLTSAVNGGTFDFSEARAAVKERMRLAVGTYRAPFGPWNVGRDEAIQADLHPGGAYTVVDRLGMPSTFPRSLKPVIERECFRQPDSCPGQVKAQAEEIARDARGRADAALANLGTLIDWLATLDGPKHVVLVTGGPVLTPDNYATIASLGARAARARVTVHALQVRDPGYQARTDQMRAAPAEIDQSQSAAFALAGTTGGLALTPVTGEIGFSRLGRELSAGYVLAFETEPADRDGKEHKIAVQVRERGFGTSLRARRTFRADPGAPVLAPPSLAIRLNPPPEAAAHVPASPQPAEAAPAPAPPASPVSAPAAKPSPADRDVEQVVQKMAGYVAAYGPQTSVIVGVEKYTQRVTIEERNVRPRMLVAEFAIVKAGGRVGWSGFRDVVEVDGKPVTDRRDRLLSLLTGPAGGEAELRRIAEESARYNVGPVVRNFNVPTTALFFFHPELVGRFAFRRTGSKKIDGVDTWALDFKETQKPTLVMKRDGSDVPCEGTVWVVPADGTIVRTRLRLRNFANLTFMSGGDRWKTDGTAVAEFVSPPPTSQAPAPPPAQTPPPAQAPPPQAPPPSPAAPSGGGQTTATAGDTRLAQAGARQSASGGDAINSFDLSPTIVELESLVDIEVTYRPEAGSGIWMPAKMTEVYEGPIPLGTRAPVRGRTVAEASYSNFKRFETSVKIVVPR